MNKNNSCRLLWVDDRVAGLTAFVAELEKANFVVTTADSTDAAIKCATTGKEFDVCLVDINMPPPDGVECLRQLRDLLPKAKLAALSGYLYQARFQAELRSLKFEVQLLDKDSDSPGTPGFEEQFISPIRRLFEEGVTTTIHTQKELASAICKGKSPFSLPLSEFNDFPLMVKDQLREEAGKIARKTLDKAFAEGKLWVMLCGDPTIIHSSGNSPTENWREDEIMDFARIQQRVPFIFWNDIDVDDIDSSWAPCGDNGGPSFYPTVTLEFGKKQVSVHFDTGAPMTFFSYEELLALEVIRPTTFFGEKRRSGIEHSNYWAAALHIRGRIRCQETGQTAEIDIRGQAVRDWDNAPFARFCKATCPGTRNAIYSQKLCPDRKALVGRNLLIENALVVVLDGKKRKTLLR